ncbi:unnamed protein product [Rhizophagus irregularis]|nr:unnamed protein product [Rhizophagus irregularis]
MENNCTDCYNPTTFGPRQKWDYTTQIWTRTGPIKVALKHLVNSLNISGSYVDQIKAHYKCIQSDYLLKYLGLQKIQRQTI